MKNFDINPELDLVLERTVDVKPEDIWRVYTNREELMKWFCPRPWKVSDCEMDLYPGGKFYTVMEGPNGEKHSGTGCFLEVVKNQKLVWTSALGPGFRPVNSPEGGLDMPFTAVIMLEPSGVETKYTAIAVHRNVSERKAHEDMGFHEGWGAAFEQMIKLIKTGAV